MPYIDPADRDELEPHSNREALTPGELNYQITCLVDAYLVANVSYESINEVVGALECSKIEVYRRLAVPYEDHKRELNGDVYCTVPVPKRKIQAQ